MKLSWLPLAELSSSTPRKGALIAMDSTGIESGVHTAKKNKVAADYRNWHDRLRLRKAAVHPPTMQSEDKHKSVKITVDREQHMKQTSLKMKSPRKPSKTRRTNPTGDVLRFKCSECEDIQMFSAEGLVGHFKLKHQTSQPVFPCDMCTFKTHKLACLQVHFLGHKDTFASCVVCDDNVQRTLSELTTHLDMQHKVKGLYLCKLCKWSVSDVRAFLEHMYLHGLTMCDTGGQSGHGELICKEPIKATQLPHRCPFCDYESPLNCIITNHIATVHGKDTCQKSKQRMRKVHKTVIDSNTRPRHRMTRNAVRDMCWMSQDCLSLPGKDFLNTYCKLSDPGKALEESRHFLERSVVAESGHEKWTKALQTVLSNVPQCQMSENSTVSSPVFLNTGNDLTVLMVKNKISVPQNRAESVGLTMVEGKKDAIFNVMPSDKQDIVSTETCSEVLCPTVNGKTCQPYSDSHLTQLTSPSESLFFQKEFSGCNQNLENGENQRVVFDQKEHGESWTQHCEEPQNAYLYEKKTEELKLRNTMSENEKATNEPHVANRKRSRRRKAFRPKIVNKPPPGLKLFLKKDPVKEMLWTSQGPSLVLGGSLLEQHQTLPHPLRTLEETQQFLHRALTEKGGLKLNKETKAEQPNIFITSPQLTAREGLLPKPSQFSMSDFNVLEAPHMTSVSHNCATNTMGLKMVDVENHFVHSVMPSSDHRAHHKIVVGLPSLEAKVGNTTTERCTTVTLNSSVVDDIQTNSKFPSVNLKSSDLYSDGENAPFKNTSLSPKNIIKVNLDGNDEAKSNKELTTQPQVVMTQGMKNLIDDPCHILDETVSVSIPQPNGQKVTAKIPNGTPTGCCPKSFSKAIEASSQSPGQEALESTRHWKPAPKHAERTLRLMPLSPNQLIKRPNEDQPVVVLNHPDTDIPEVRNIMEVVHRYQGEIQKVVLSRLTLKALSALDSEVPWEGDPTKGSPSSPFQGRLLPENTVKERFILKLKVKKMSRKKYRVVDADSLNTHPPVRFDCWFCGRVFSNQEMWICHGQRHLMEGKRQSSEP